MSKRIHLRIIGMSCGGCVAKVQRALRDIDGVRDAVVNLMDESASVVVGPDGPQAPRMLEVVRGAGYDGEVLVTGSELADRFSSDRELRETERRHRQAMIQVIGTGLPILAVEWLMPVLWGETPQHQLTARLLQIILLVMLAVSPAGAPILVNGLRSLVHRVGNMDLLVTIAVFSAFISSLYGIFIARSNAFIHLHAATMILSFVAIGRYLEAKARRRASQAMIDIASRAPKRALVRRGDEWVSTLVDDIGIGDQVKIPQHEAIPVDGVIVEGSADIDEQLMTGEPMPVTRADGGRVCGGTRVVDGTIVIRATEIGARSAMGRILEQVHRAQASRTEMQRLADRIAAVFTPGVIVLALLAFIGWMVSGGLHAGADAARAALAVLVVACPCALGLATPTVVFVASGMAALRGILVRDAETLEKLARVDLIIWDKTGTLTQGQPSVRSFTPVEGFDPDHVIRQAASAEQLSAHPLARAIVSFANRQRLTLGEAQNHESVPGGGVCAEVDEQTVMIGRRDFLESRGITLDDKVAPEPVGTRAWVAIDARVAGVFLIDDLIRPSTASTIEALRSLGIEQRMVTGDNAAVAEAIAKQAGLTADAVSANVNPAGKVAEVTRHAHRQVAMVGDGINDAAAIGSADVGIAFAAGASMASEAAGIQLVGSTPSLVADAVVLSRNSLRIIRQNLFWAFFYNLLMIPFAAIGWLPPGVAAAAMVVSSLTVVLNALRLGNMK